jgi:hypothetical protein
MPRAAACARRRSSFGSWMITRIGILQFGPPYRGNEGRGTGLPRRGIVLAGAPVVYARQALEVTAALVHIPIG